MTTWTIDSKGHPAASKHYLSLIGNSAAEPNWEADLFSNSHSLVREHSQSGMHIHFMNSVISFMIGISLRTSATKLETDSPISHISSGSDIQQNRSESHRRAIKSGRLLTEVGRCNVGSEKKCKLVFSRHAESEKYMRWIRNINHDITKIILNTGKKLEISHPHCESRIWANVGREAFKYISYILDNYNSPENFAPITVFCQINPHYRYYDENLYIRDIHNLCLEDSDSSDMMKWGFLFLGHEVQDFNFGMHNPTPTKLFHSLFNSTTDLPYRMKFVPGGCFAVSKENILSNSIEFYHRLLSTGNGTYHPLNEENAPLIGFIYERSWPRIMNSDCEKKQPWCCNTECNMTAVREWETSHSTPLQWIRRKPDKDELVDI